MPRKKKNKTGARIQLKPSEETLTALLFIALCTDYRGNTAIIEAAVQRWAVEFKKEEQGGAIPCPVCSKMNCRGNTECIHCDAQMPITPENTGPDAWHKPKLNNNQ